MIGLTGGSDLYLRLSFVGPLAIASGGFRVAWMGYNPWGRSEIKLEVEAKPLDQDFDGFGTVISDAEDYFALFMILLPILRAVIFAFGQPEFFMLVMMGLMLTGALAGKSLARGLIMAAAGLLPTGCSRLSHRPWSE